MEEQDLRKLSVYELRMLAREVGVRSPTSKSCEQMITEILAIKNGELAPFKAKRAGLQNLRAKILMPLKM